MSIFTTVRNDIEYPFEQLWDEVAPVFQTDVLPELKAFLKLFATDEGKLILTTAMTYVPQILEKGFGVVTAEVIAVLVGQSVVIAKQDAQVTLNQVQSALQIAKVAANITTTADQTIMAASA